MAQKIVFFDIDGTLYDEDKKLPSATKQAISQLREKGHYVAIATGRAPFLFADLREELQIDTYVCFNGSYVVVDNKVLSKNVLDQKALEKLTEFSAEKEHPLVYMGTDDMKSNIEEHPHIEESMGTLKCYQPGHDANYHIDRDIIQTLLFCTDKEEKEYVERFPEFDFVRWHTLSVDVLPANGSKAVGVEKVIEHLGFNKEDVYAFGDGLNDIEMLKAVENSVAMGNGHDEVKSAAKHVTKHVSEDGIYHGLKMVGLL
ncbi:Cof-type HAD-IIB family hydrolase [Halalkalibacter krulwichiae]|uniref:Putative bifunctional phosphatase/peptidyl-prolyl cis-trans isomerase n=1 Tax=Halalkalibacter krulwichiae TaxID=199441 RepID=A0A1X9MEF7_9BACI|nr:Cof-type HAD-IIB family hydrolase [Halalkalibacter krulwichiae]ARK31825.1 Putative bifunctional phosphatase/peptidyl-prolyl cis-trans isomerase [Halalkalibacter krulwichiae]